MMRLPQPNAGSGKFARFSRDVRDSLRSLQPARAAGVQTAHRTTGVTRKFQREVVNFAVYPLTLGIVEIVKPQVRQADGSVTTSSNRLLICRQFTTGMVYFGSYYAVQPPFEYDTIDVLNVPDIGNVTTTDVDYNQISVSRTADNLRVLTIEGDPVAFPANHIFRPDRTNRQIWWPRYEANVIIRAFPAAAPLLLAGNGLNNDPALITATHRYGEAMVQNYFDMNVDARRWVNRYDIAGDATAYRPAVYEDEVLVQEEMEAGVFDGNPPADFES